MVISKQINFTYSQKAYPLSHKILPSVSTLFLTKAYPLSHKSLPPYKKPTLFLTKNLPSFSQKSIK